jgi:hypothetical protein
LKVDTAIEDMEDGSISMIDSEMHAEGIGRKVGVYKHKKITCVGHTAKH